MLDKKVLQLVLDVDIRWSSTDIMIERAIELCEGIELFLDKRDFTDLRKHKLSKDEWKALEIIHQILAVRLHIQKTNLPTDICRYHMLSNRSYLLTRRQPFLWQFQVSGE
ncbi:hypothetical protein EV421DRAFT_1501626 [Armillaria borealis]|uniref:Uncharacterized protein n=1 Tax=Armillaria borealis TaxID=47425 RepID=A0AA39IZI7_9AGAR|nr:hypothetical protein EV421DRAFT_1501626 [Armillaria borealis]